MVTAASEMELFLPKSYDIFWSLVILIVVAVFFYKFFLPKFQAVFDERAAKIEGGIAKAEQAQKDADEAKAKYDAQLSNARVEASKIATTLARKHRTSSPTHVPVPRLMRRRSPPPPSVPSSPSSSRLW